MLGFVDDASLCCKRELDLLQNFVHDGKGVPARKLRFMAIGGGLLGRARLSALAVDALCSRGSLATVGVYGAFVVLVGARFLVIGTD